MTWTNIYQYAEAIYLANGGDVCQRLGIWDKNEQLKFKENMTYRKEQELSKQQEKFLASIKTQNFLKEYTTEELHDVFNTFMSQGYHGMCFSMYEDGQEPGHHITEKQVLRRMNILKPHIK